MDRGPWWAAVHRVAKSRTRLSDFTFHFHALEKEMATHSSALAWRIPGTGEPGGLPSMGSHRVGHNWSDLAAAEVFEGIRKLWFSNTTKKGRGVNISSRGNEKLFKKKNTTAIYNTTCPSKEQYLNTHNKEYTVNIFHKNFYLTTGEEQWRVDRPGGELAKLLIHHVNEAIHRSA